MAYAGCLELARPLRSGYQPERLRVQFLRELSIGEIVSRLAGVLLYVGLQGVLLAGLAWLMGDRRPRFDGRLSLNPFVHLSVWGAVMAALFAASWPRAVWFDAAQNRLGRIGVALVTLGALVAMVVLVVLVNLVQPVALLLPRSGSYVVLYVLGQFKLIAVSASILNLLPVPGLAGGGWLQAIWPQSERRLRRAEPICLAIVVAVIVAGGYPNPAPMILSYVQPG